MSNPVGSGPPGVSDPPPHNFGPGPEIPPVNVNEVQGDVILGLHKRNEAFFFFQITDPGVFRIKLVGIIPQITTTADVKDQHEKIVAFKRSPDARNNKLLPLQGLNVAFSQTGLTKLGITDNLGDPLFSKGQLADAEDLGDPAVPNSSPFEPANWLPAFKGVIHGVFTITGDSRPTVDSVIRTLKDTFIDDGDDASIVEVTTIRGAVRPGDEAGHEHFGFKDCISQPDLNVVPPHPGQQFVPPGAILTNTFGDPVAKRPKWTANGSFLAFRVLQQAVPEFNAFLKANALFPDSVGRDAGAQLLGARLFGRWKSGAPIDVTPLKDDPILADNPSLNNLFDFSDDKTETRCPFAAHIRKTNPRSDLPAKADAAHKMIRQGIPYGPELSDSEKNGNVTEHDRGLLFACYQSTIANGFKFLQQSWANNPTFPPKSSSPGLDPIIGQGSAPRQMEGTNPKSQSTVLAFPFFVLPKGGEYFFVPSITALKTVISDDSGTTTHV